ncbi:unnamed protein product [Orchesella dallaii]|uniref:Uncharacterized protein n=1 Tax=Orchesella dallaii TaxID=48710 RepID=A0ABP1PJ44_9HEXA
MKSYIPKSYTHFLAQELGSHIRKYVKSNISIAIGLHEPNSLELYLLSGNSVCYQNLQTLNSPNGTLMQRLEQTVITAARQNLRDSCSSSNTYWYRTLEDSSHRWHTGSYFFLSASACPSSKPSDETVMSKRKQRKSKGFPVRIYECCWEPWRELPPSSSRKCQNPTAK